MIRETITIKEKNGRVLASGVEAKEVTLFEGTWYFDPNQVDMTHLVVTNRTYICPYKGTCYWIDLDAPDHQAKDVAFTYFEIKPGYEFIRDKIGFYAGRRESTYEEATPLNGQPSK